VSFALAPAPPAAPPPPAPARLWRYVDRAGRVSLPCTAAELACKLASGAVDGDAMVHSMADNSNNESDEAPISMSLRAMLARAPSPPKAPAPPALRRPAAALPARAAPPACASAAALASAAPAGGGGASADPSADPSDPCVWRHSRGRHGRRCSKRFHYT